MLMLGGRLLMLVVLGQSPGAADVPPSDLVSASAPAPAPADLVARLGANRYAEREAAARALEQLGRPALPALRAGGSSRDPEVRRQAQRIVLKIERALLVQASRVRLDFDNALVGDVARSLSEQTGFAIELGPQNRPDNWKARRVTLHETGELPFWQALDQFCAAAGFQYVPYRLHTSDVLNGATPSIALTDGSRLGMAMPVSNHGPFRVSLVSLDYQRHVNYRVRVPVLPPVPAPGAGARPARRIADPTVVDGFAAHVAVAAEPRLAMSMNGAVRVIEAVDDRGNSLMVPAKNANGAGRVVERSAGYLGVAGGPYMACFNTQAVLHRPDAPGRRVKVFRGVVPVVVASRRPDPLVVPLVPGTSKRFEGDDVSIALHEVRGEPATNRVFIELSVQPRETRPSDGDRAVVDGFRRAPFNGAQKLQMEILDTKGKVLSWSITNVDAERSRLTLVLRNVVRPGMIKELRYYSLTRAAAEVPFEFRDFVMP